MGVRKAIKGIPITQRSPGRLTFAIITQQCQDPVSRTVANLVTHEAKDH